MWEVKIFNLYLGTNGGTRHRYHKGNLTKFETHEQAAKAYYNYFKQTGMQETYANSKLHAGHCVIQKIKGDD
jgi:hypothetical protein